MFSFNEYSLCPYFDQGLSLLSDTEGFWLDGDFEKHIMRVSAKPFGSFDSQFKAVQNIYGNTLVFDFGMADVDSVLEKFKGVYSDKILVRVKNIIEFQYKKYSAELFKR